MTHYGARFAIVLGALLATACSQSSNGADPLAEGALSGRSLQANATAGVGQRDGDLEVVGDLPPPSGSGLGGNQALAADDLLEIQVFRAPDLNTSTRIGADGEIDLALIGKVRAAGRTVPELKSEIERRYGTDYLQNPDVRVFLKESMGMRVTIDGAVMKPGIVPVTSGTTLLQIMAQAGGLAEIADVKKVYVYRRHGERSLVANYSIADIRAGKKADPRIYGGDTVVAFTSDSKVAAKNLREALGMAASATRFVPLF